MMLQHCTNALPCTHADDTGSMGMQIELGWGVRQRFTDEGKRCSDGFIAIPDHRAVCPVMQCSNDDLGRDHCFHRPHLIKDLRNQSRICRVVSELDT